MALVIGLCAYQRGIDAGRFGAAGTGAGFLGCGAGRCCLCAAYDVAIASVPLGKDVVPAADGSAAVTEAPAESAQADKPAAKKAAAKKAPAKKAAAKPKTVKADTAEENEEAG